MTTMTTIGSTMAAALFDAFGEAFSVIPKVGQMIEIIRRGADPVRIGTRLAQHRETPL